MTAQIIHGDCIDVMRTMPDSSIDAIVTDPPYNLSDSGKRDTDCLRRILVDVGFPDHQQGQAKRSKRGELPAPGGSGAPLGGVLRPVGIGAGVSMPEGPVNLQDSPVVQNEIGAGHEATMSAANANLPAVSDTQPGQDFGHYVFRLADGAETSCGNGTCSCFTEPNAGFIAVPVTLSGSAARGLTSLLLGSGWASDTDVRLDDNAGSSAHRAPGVVAGAGAVLSAVLCLDLRGRTAELRPANSAREQGSPLQIVAAESVGTGTRAGDLSSVLEPLRVRLVDDVADRTLTLDFPWHRVKSSKTTGGFMGKKWDGWESPAAFQRWCTAWTTEALRVLKPGGHLLAFGGTRTWHRLACAVEDAGFEMRDSIAWLYGSGFPKSLDVSKAIDKAAGAEREVVGSKSQSGGWHHDATINDDGWTGGDQSITAPATEAAQQWQGWGTALKPAFEPVVVARKPLAAGTVAANVLQFGTGALNIDGCRIDGQPRTTHADGNHRTKPHTEIYGKGFGVHGGEPAPAGRWPANVVLDESQAAALDEMSGIMRDGTATNRNRNSAAPRSDGVFEGGFKKPTDDQGYGGIGGASRFFYVARQDGVGPALAEIAFANGRESIGHVLLTIHHPDENGFCDACFDQPFPCPTLVDTGLVALAGEDSPDLPIDSLEARFRYCAKAPKSERPVVDGVAHATVKPLSLMRWLVRLVTPPGGVVLDPFAGSGTTVEAALLEGFSVIGIEREADYLPLIQHRIERAEAARAVATIVPDQLDLFADEP